MSAYLILDIDVTEQELHAVCVARKQITPAAHFQGNAVYCRKSAEPLGKPAPPHHRYSITSTFSTPISRTISIWRSRSPATSRIWVASAGI